MSISKPYHPPSAVLQKVVAKAPPAFVSFSEVMGSEPLHDSSAAVIVKIVGPASVPDAENDSVQVSVS